MSFDVGTDILNTLAAMELDRSGIKPGALVRFNPDRVHRIRDYYHGKFDPNTIYKIEETIRSISPKFRVEGVTEVCLCRDFSPVKAKDAAYHRKYGTFNVEDPNKEFDAFIDEYNDIENFALNA